MKKWTIIIVLVLTLTNSNVFTSKIYANPTKDELQSTYADYLKKYDVIKGYPDGTLKLDKNLTRAEFTSLLLRIKKYDEVNVKSHILSYKDLNSSHWAYNDLKIADYNNLITGYNDNTLRPNNPISYAEALTVVVKALGYGDELTGIWPLNVISLSEDLNLTNNFKMDANKKITRGETCVLLYNTLVSGFN
jgi:hypothetical protein